MAAADLMPGLLAHLNITTLSEGTAAELLGVLSAAYTHVENRVGTLDEHELVSDVYSAGGVSLVLPEMRVAEVTEIIDPGLQVVDLDEVTVHSAAGIVVVPVGYVGTWTVTATYGGTIPADLQLAILIVAAHLYETQRVTQPGGGRVGFNPGEQAAPGYSAGYAIPNRASDLMAPYMVPSLA